MDQCVSGSDSWIFRAEHLNQPITTPLFFVFMAMGVGTVNYCRRVKELEKRA